MRFSVALPIHLFRKNIYIVRPIGYMDRIMRRIVRDLKRNHFLLAFDSRNVGSLFYLTIIRCQCRFCTALVGCRPSGLR